MRKKQSLEVHVIQPTGVYSLDEASEVLGIAKTRLLEAVRDGSLRATRPGQHYLVTGEWLLDFVRCPTPQVPVPA
jgi:excisionase family DNA binding protein